VGGVGLSLCCSDIIGKKNNSTSYENLTEENEQDLGILVKLL
jgi:hypothetical protein